MDRNSSSSIFISSGAWTNEKHLHYLNSMEASFVRKMFESNRRPLRLDRCLPDTSDSTLDLKQTTSQSHLQRTKKHLAAAAAISAAQDIVGPKTGMDSRADKRFTRRRSHQPYTSSQDQVVPQIGNRRCDKDESDPFDAPN